MLAIAGRDGMTHPLLMTLGFDARMIADLVNKGLATDMLSRVRSGGKIIGRVRIKAAGRRALVVGLRAQQPATPRSQAKSHVPATAAAPIRLAAVAAAEAGQRSLAPSADGKTLHLLGNKLPRLVASS